MSTDVSITYYNNAMNPDRPTVFVFTKNYVPTFDVLKDGVAWLALPDIGKGSSSSFVFPIRTTVQGMWGGSNKTRSIEAEIGKRYTVLRDETGIVLDPGGDASQKTAIEVSSQIKVDGGIKAQICKDGKVLVTKEIVAYNQKATFVLHPKLYWGLASEIQDGQQISSAVLDTDNFFEMDIEGLISADVVLTGNTKDGYNFSVENKK